MLHDELLFTNSDMELVFALASIEDGMENGQRAFTNVYVCFNNKSHRSHQINEIPLKPRHKPLEMYTVALSNSSTHDPK